MTIHGLMTVKEDFGRLYDYLDCYDQVLAVEIPGHNGKAKLKDFTVQRTFDTVLSAYDKLSKKHNQVDVVGFSMGGALATWLCGQRNVHKAVLLTPANKYINLLMPVESLKFYGNGVKPLLDKTGASLADKGFGIKQVFADYFENVCTTLKIVIDNFKCDRVLTPQIFNIFRNIVKQCNKMVEGHSPINTPTLVLWGKLDELVPNKSIQYVLQHFAKATDKVYEDIGHAMLYTNHDHILIKDIMDFLTDGKFNKEVTHRA